jgi:hypothetical protein
MLHQLPKTAAPEQRLRLLQQALYLWFDHQVSATTNEVALLLALKEWWRQRGAGLKTPLG